MYNYFFLICLLFVNKFGVECFLDIFLLIRINGEFFIICFIVVFNIVIGLFDCYLVIYYCREGNNL